MPNRETIGSRIKSLRESLGLSKSELSRRCGVTTTAVWNWEENGRVPRIDTLELAAKTLGVTQRFLTTGEVGATPVAPMVTTVAPRTVAAIIEDARSEIAAITGVPFPNVRLNVEFLSQ